MNKITVLCEVDYSDNILKDVSYELLSKASELKKQALQLKNEIYEVEAVIINNWLCDELIKKAYCYGADKVVLIKNVECSDFSFALQAKAFVEYYSANPSKVILFPATVWGRSIAPRITTMLDTGLVADCTQVEFILKDNEIKLAPTRPTFGSELMATILSKKIPECATIRPKTFEIKYDSSRFGQYSEFISNIQERNRILLLKTVLDDKVDEGDFSNAKIILTAGYGLIEGKNDQYVRKLKELADLIGAKFASTRKLVDFNYTNPSSQIGQTGSSVTAELYIAFGVSGAIQHICGMKNSKKIIAINTDSNAPIFQYSDYKIIADARKIIDEMLKEV